ncbi:MAG: 50S ribosomal protein L3 [Mollicutes bacterium PWAP]|nr:50S ribosomal protein L3 [Mollicutes bacterium PWAP]
MKGILGRKVGMTTIFEEHGKAMPVTVIEIQPNFVSAVFTKETHGYNAVQLAAFDYKNANKPALGHFKKSGTDAKRFIKEIRHMEGFTIGQKIDASIFTSGELVDVIGTSKGKGFAGAIKRHNQKIGPKSHGGGGGSKPVRLTGSLGDIAGNKVVKGMTMPGHMGAKSSTTQNLLVVTVDVKNNLIVVKGSVPGPKKGFVVVRAAVKALPSRESVKLVDVEETNKKNELLEEAKHFNAEVNTDMTISEMETIIIEAKSAKKAKINSEKEAATTEANKKEETKREEAKSKAETKGDN